jgi:hypothetical protein
VSLIYLLAGLLLVATLLVGSSVAARRRALLRANEQRYIREMLCPRCGGAAVERHIGPYNKLGLCCTECSWRLCYSPKELAERKRLTLEAKLRAAIDHKVEVALAGDEDDSAAKKLPAGPAPIFIGPHFDYEPHAPLERFLKAGICPACGDEIRINEDASEARCRGVLLGRCAWKLKFDSAQKEEILRRRRIAAELKLAQLEGRNVR